ncbi:MAG: bifunctional 2-C-methyl-D-erythritol 4-phosphate cytidylyltransferase/2-C-methyl-D-erythritol 2,4-cyclodiphosphate synthase [Rhodothalassiaceae bacterium]
MALIVAAGRGVRAGGGLPKQYRRLAGRMVLSRTLSAFAAHPDIAGIRVVIHPDDRALYDEAASGFALGEPVAGGASRQDSVLNGLEALARETETPDIVLIHDAARCFVDAALISRVIAAIGERQGAIPGLPVSDTLKRGVGGLVSGTLEREGLWRVQTPQGFPFVPILAAHRAARGASLTDDAAVAEAQGLPVALVEGSEDNIKMTTPEDFARMAHSGMETRVGQGFDVHRFAPGDHVWLCGLKIPHGMALKGHSDADVGLHALTDAVLGALGAGDIGIHFPPSDPQWKGASSDRFLAHAGDLVQKAGGRILHLDVTLICEAPRIGPHKDRMRTRIAAILDIPIARVSVKATTTEELGFTGRREGIAAQAVATISLPAPD